MTITWHMFEMPGNTSLFVHESWVPMSPARRENAELASKCAAARYGFTLAAEYQPSLIHPNTWTMSGRCEQKGYWGPWPIGICMLTYTYTHIYISYKYIHIHMHTHTRIGLYRHQESMLLSQQYHYMGPEQFKTSCWNAWGIKEQAFHCKALHPSTQWLSNSSIPNSGLWRIIL